jgi:hypothetical protein
LGRAGDLSGYRTAWQGTGIPNRQLWAYSGGVRTRLWWLLGFALSASTWAQAPGARLPRLDDYPVAEFFKGTPAAPILATPEERRYRTRIREGVSLGRGVWTGSWKDAKEKPGPNFAGHYFVIRWGCGSDCLMMALVDAETGKVYPPPMSGVGTELYVPMDIMSEREVDFRLDSSLMILRNACREARRECGVYCFNWKGNHFDLVKRVLVDLTKSEGEY